MERLEDKINHPHHCAPIGSGTKYYLGHQESSRKAVVSSASTSGGLHALGSTPGSTPL